MECDRIGISRNEAAYRLAERHGWEPKRYDELEDADLEVLYSALLGWS